jgi:hypothetical protein
MSALKIAVSKYEKHLFGLVLILTVIVRAVRFTGVPGGLNQDEASMGYDAWATAFHGIDRNGYSFPAYAVSWGSGQNTLYMYITALFVRLFGLNVFSVRLTALLFGIAAPVILYLLVKKLSPGKPHAALCAMALLAVSPWHIMLSRWALESNLLPCVFLIAVYLLVLAADKRCQKREAHTPLALRRQTLLYCAAAAVLALSMYAYATVCIVMPLFVCAVMVFLLRGKYISVKQGLFSAGVFLLVSLPLILFYIVNFFGLESIVTPFFSAPRLSAMRGTTAFDSIGDNFRGLLRLLLVQYDGLLWNSLEKIGITYIYMTPFALVGIYAVIAERKTSPLKGIMLIWFFCAVVLGCLININTNRVNLIFIPLIWLISEGAVFICERLKPAKFIVAAAVLAGFAAFNISYFGEKHTKTIEQYFYKSYGEAVKYAAELDVPVYLDPGVPYTLTLFYTKTDPREFVDTVVYTRPDWEFRPVESFGKYIFSMPDNPPHTGSAYVVRNHDTRLFDREKFDIIQFEYFSAVVGSASPQGEGCGME